MVRGCFYKTKRDKEKNNKNTDNDDETGDESGEQQSNSSDTLLFLAPNEVKKIAQVFADNGFDEILTLKEKDQKKRVKQVSELINKSDMNALDIALFGRMVAQATSLNVEAACSFAHAISTHKVVNEVEFFTAVDDDPCKLRTDAGSAHMGSLEYNSATYYRYISLDLGQLKQTLGDSYELKYAIDVFVKALYEAVPSARQSSMTGGSYWDYARVLVRKGQRLQASFEQPVKSKGEGFLHPSKDELKSWLDKKEKLSGSLFGKQGDYEWGENLDYSIDHLIADLQSHL
ncbi:type I-E CRISPR-associated protein Cas7/Cse4/CasC [Dickeya zeae]|uniref:type I-E CRISPR-associated protein Cas7/Cse4/CasC n=1 Tax=Dickeya zeae TaxID=204042 RepID=UPI0022A936C6|nr:type I-E CRISPR-associated protein Cas7/Cse4/CasC [Dickeya zeae]